MVSTVSLHDLPQWVAPASEPELLTPMASSCSSLDDDEDAIFTIYDLLLQRARNVPDEPLVGYPGGSQDASHYSYYNAIDLIRFAEGAAKNLVAQGLPENVG